MKYFKNIKFWGTLLILIGIGYYVWWSQQPEQQVDLNDPESVRAYLEKHRKMTGYEAAAKYPQLRDMTYRITINNQDLHIPIPYYSSA
ncbi:MAG: hypothetical protein CUN55_21430, partial [Phototrophicales bacterium]